MFGINLVVGDRVTWEAPQFKGGSFFRGRFRGAKFCGNKEFSGVIERDSYGATGQHTFSIRLDDGTLKRVMGRNLYPNLLDHEPGPDHDERAAAKQARSEAARQRRDELGMQRAVLR